MPSPTDTPGTRLALALKRAGVSQAELARRLGVGRTVVHQVIRGDWPPSLDWLWEAAVAIGVDPNELDSRLANRSGG